MFKQTIRSDCNKHIIKREHYCRKNGNWKPKKSFESEDDASSWITKYKMYKYVILSIKTILLIFINYISIGLFEMKLYYIYWSIYIYLYI